MSAFGGKADACKAEFFRQGYGKPFKRRTEASSSNLHFLMPGALIGPQQK
jgi:hypothetical protein